MARVTLWVALLTVWLFSAFSAVLVVQSFGPEPGANMVLMGVECLAPPTFLAAAVAVGVVSMKPAGLAWWERKLGWIAGGFSLAVYGVLIVLG